MSARPQSCVTTRFRGCHAPPSRGMTTELRRRPLPPEARDEIGDIRCRDRPARQITLHLGAAGAPHDVELLLGLDAFRRGLDPEARAETGDRLDDHRAVAVAV